MTKQNYEACAVKSHMAAVKGRSLAWENTSKWYADKEGAEITH